MMAKCGPAGGDVSLSQHRRMATCGRSARYPRHRATAARLGGRLRGAWHEQAGVNPSRAVSTIVSRLPQAYLQSNVGTRLHFAAASAETQS